MYERQLFIPEQLTVSVTFSCIPSALPSFTVQLVSESSPHAALSHHSIMTSLYECSQMIPHDFGLPPSFRCGITPVRQDRLARAKPKWPAIVDGVSGRYTICQATLHSPDIPSHHEPCLHFETPKISAPERLRTATFAHVNHDPGEL